MRIILSTVIIILLSSCHIFLGNDPGNCQEKILESIWKDFNETYGPMEIREKNLGFK